MKLDPEKILPTLEREDSKSIVGLAIGTIIGVTIWGGLIGMVLALFGAR